MSEYLNENGWLYIAVDLLNPFLFKFGFTRRKNVFSRITETGNPNYVLIRGYKFPFPCDGLRIEKELHYKLSQNFERQQHFITGNNSEWFSSSISEAISLLDSEFAEWMDYVDHKDYGTPFNELKFKDFPDGDEVLNIQHLIFDPYVNFSALSQSYAVTNSYIYELYLHSNSIYGLSSYTWIQVFTRNYPYTINKYGPTPQFMKFLGHSRKKIYDAREKFLIENINEMKSISDKYQNGFLD